MALPANQYRNPERWLERRGQDCTHCASLTTWRLCGTTMQSCDNTQAPKTRREQAPARRCDQWRHSKADGGQ
jgi:hypothetical protein